MNWLKRFFTKRSNSPVTVVVKQAHEISLEEWRSTPNLVLEAKALLKNPTFQSILVVMKEESPVNYVPNVEGVNATKDLETLGEIRGYHKALNNLASFALPIEKPIDLEPTFGVPDEKEPNE